jgi:hypothetical protein
VDDVVLVPMGSQGLLRRAPGGDWERVAVGSARPIRTDGPSWFAELLGTPWALVVAAPALVLLALKQGHSSLRALASAAVAMVGAAALLMVVELSDVTATDYADLGPGVALASVVVFLVSLVVAALPPPAWRRRRPAVTRPPSGGASRPPDGAGVG